MKFFTGNGIRSALDAYEGLSAEAKALLLAEKAVLDGLIHGASVDAAH
jgi:hypothetical protein